MTSKSGKNGKFIFGNTMKQLKILNPKFFFEPPLPVENYVTILAAAQNYQLGQEYTYITFFQNALNILKYQKRFHS